MENVTQIHNEQNIKDFGSWITFLDSLGYISKWQDLDAKNYGIPQTRDRCFLISYLDKSLKYSFPAPVELTKTVRDYLEDVVNEKYYIRQDKAQELVKKFISEESNNCIKIKANNSEGFYTLKLGGICDLSYPDSTTKRARVQSNGDICPTISTCYRLDKIEKINAYVNYNRIDSIGAQSAFALCSRDYKGFSSGKQSQTQNGVIENNGYLYRIRKLTPLECLRLMDLTDEEALKMLAVNSEGQCYKQAGNSIVVSVMVYIFKNLFLGGSEKESRQIDIFDIL